MSRVRAVVVCAVSLSVGLAIGVCSANETPAIAGKVAQASPSGSEFDDLREAERLSVARRERFSREMAEASRLIDEIKRLAFVIDLRIAKIRAGDYQRLCDTSGVEAAAIAESLATIRQMQSETATLCGSLTAGDADQKEICAQRGQELEVRVAELLASDKELRAACPQPETGEELK